MEKDRTLKAGDVVIYLDEHGVKHSALVTYSHLADCKNVGEFQEKFGPGSMPCINLVFVTKDPDRKDGYGQQIERRSSVVHHSRMSGVSGAMFFWPDERQ